MNHHAYQASNTAPVRVARADAIEWEELPSLANSLNQRLVMLGTRPLAERVKAASLAWAETITSEFDVLPPSEPFHETLTGLATREVHEPEVFRLFFGA